MKGVTSCNEKQVITETISTMQDFKLLRIFNCLVTRTEDALAVMGVSALCTDVSPP